MVELTKLMTIYFGYGSNLWREQMTQRCPQSKYLGVGRLQDYKWIIYERGYANVIANQREDEVYALIYSLTSSDEAALDINEGVPHAYQKNYVDVEFWRAEDDKGVFVGDKSKMEIQNMLVYMNHNGTSRSKPKREYIYRMNKGIDDALAAGVPSEYIERVIRPFIPIKTASKVEAVAHQQALAFEDEI